VPLNSPQWKWNRLSIVAEARRQVERLEGLVTSGAASESLLDQRRRDYQTALARLNIIKARIDDRRITAPFNGVVGLRNISVGSLLQPGMPITTLDDDSLMKLEFFCALCPHDYPGARTGNYCPSRTFR
jgi:membrane fusion protein, multidrug efflux system